MELADEYYNYSLRCMHQLMYRLAVDLGQNAIELMLKALILARGKRCREAMEVTFIDLEKSM